MGDIFGTVDPASLFFAIVSVIFSEFLFRGTANDGIKKYNVKVLCTIQFSYDQTDIYRPLRNMGCDLSNISVTRLCGRMTYAFNTSYLLRFGTFLSIHSQRFNSAIIILGCLAVSNFCHWLHSWKTRIAPGLWTFDLEWSELTVTMAIEELRDPGRFGDTLLKVLYKVTQLKSGPFACKLPIDDNSPVHDDDAPTLAELLVATFALYNVDGPQVVEHQEIRIVNLATLTFERVDEFRPSLVAVNVTIETVMTQFAVNATAQCQQDSDGASNAAYLIQYAIATDNHWLLPLSLAHIDNMVNVPHTHVLREMARAAGNGIALYRRRVTHQDIRNSTYWDWLTANFSFVTPLAWCQHHTISPNRCHCWLTHFLIMSPEVAAQLYVGKAQRNIIAVTRNEEEGAIALQRRDETRRAFVRLSTQSQNLANSPQFKRTDRIILAVAMPVPGTEAQ
ncbi:unnamed protein product [Absidia cylindrospora]